MEYSKQAQGSNETEICRFFSLLPFLNDMEHCVKRMAEVLYAKAYYRALYDEALAKVMAEIDGSMVDIGHLSQDPAAQIGMIRNFIGSASFFASLNDRLPSKHSTAKSDGGKI